MDLITGYGQYPNTPPSKHFNLKLFHRNRGKCGGPSNRFATAPRRRGRQAFLGEEEKDCRGQSRCFFSGRKRYLHRSSKTLPGISGRLVSMEKERSSSRRNEARRAHDTVRRGKTKQGEGSEGGSSLIPSHRKEGASGRANWIRQRSKGRVERKS